MGINCTKIKGKDIPPNAICNFNHPNKNNVPLQSQITQTMGVNQNFFEGNNKLEFVNSKTINLKIFHQNIRGIRNKVDELVLHLSESNPQVLCVTEHHLKDFEINNTGINNYILGAYYCRKTRKSGGAVIFIHDTLLCTPINLTEYCNELDLEACAIKLKVLNKVFCILCIYRPPTGNFETFIHLLESLLNKLYTNSINVIICGDVNINYLKASNYKN